MQTEFARGQMITQQVRAWDVLDERVLNAMRTVRRERFVPERFRELAFADAEIPLGHGEHMLTPKLIGRIVQALELAPGARVLEIGTGSGYLSACLASLGATVQSLELRADIADFARRNLAASETTGVEVLTADAFASELGDGFSQVVLTGSLPIYDERFQRALAIDGRLFAVVGRAPLMDARLITRLGANEWRHESLFETVIAPLKHAATPAPFAF